mmetsp:Transcript_8339/g.51990  ORF Transcript_8339/g.51990 Transcript_8339/m.51990 type:complete len:205 (-) Transcript_8339:2253-2867(-)
MSMNSSSKSTSSRPSSHVARDMAMRFRRTCASTSRKHDLVPYQKPMPAEAQREIWLPKAWPSADEQVWVPQSPGVSFRPLCFHVSQGYYVNLLRVKKAGVLSRHRHVCPVHGYVLKGSWKYLEHEWVAQEGDYVFEPPGETHTLVVPEEVEEMVTMFHVTGALLYCDPHGEVTGYEDVFTKLEKAKAYYEKIGLGEEYALQFVR